ncbi:MAG: glycosyltransferase family 4 protein [Deltaproteobacteria bacterium]|nr:glycosyltransferase family 4 protein [Deltaproteobacteria bacterium]
MRIAQVAPLYESVPPQGYGGTERVVSWLTEELVAAGHDVTLFASGDSQTSARLVPCCTRALRLARAEDDISPHILAVERAMKASAQFDVVHFHTGTVHFPSARRSPVPTVSTVHGRVDLEHICEVHWEFRELPLVSLCDQQREGIPWARWVKTVSHGMPPERLRFDADGGDKLVFLGRLARDKRPDRAIRIARAAGVGLQIAAKLDVKDEDYFRSEIAALLDGGDGVEVLGEIDDSRKQAVLGGALGLLFPIDWPEPFGLVMIEALACGTPVIAWRCGSVPSVVEDGVSGFIVDTEEEAVEAVRALPSLDRRRVRAAFDRRFTSSRMMLDYVALYRDLIDGKVAPMGRAEAP